MSHKFEDFFDHESDGISQAAKLLAEAKTALDAGDINGEEFEIITDDILSIAHVDNLADDVDDKDKYKSIYNTLKTIVTTAVAVIPK